MRLLPGGAVASVMAIDEPRPMHSRWVVVLLQV